MLEVGGSVGRWGSGTVGRTVDIGGTPLDNSNSLGGVVQHSFAEFGMSKASTIEQRLAVVEKDVSELKLGFSRPGSKRDRPDRIAGASNEEVELHDTASLTDIGTLIAQTPGICGGRPRLAGTGVSVRRIVGWYKLGLTPDEIAVEIPHLDLAQVYAALSYYYANRAEMDAAMAAEEAEADRLEREHCQGKAKS